MDGTFRRVIWFSHSLMVLTSIHHIYGAVIYNTPWRLHAAFVGAGVILLTSILYLLGELKSKRINILFWINWLVILTVSIGLVGIFEGIYNHVIKDVLFILGVPIKTMQALFPPPRYEMPNDFIFEATGILQAVVTFLLIGQFIQITKLKISQ